MELCSYTLVLLLILLTKLGLNMVGLVALFCSDFRDLIDTKLISFHHPEFMGKLKIRDRLLVRLAVVDVERH